MHPITTFDSTKEALRDILQSIHTGRTQLPDFQRGWVWDNDRIRSLLASVSLAYPIGAVMVLQTGSAEVNFKPRLIEGVALANATEPERLVLDGQQRLTSLYRALWLQQPVDTEDAKRNPVKRWYYLNINGAVNHQVDREDAIISVPEDRKIRNFRGEVTTDCASTDLEIQHEMLPLNIIFDSSALMRWQMEYLKAGGERIERWQQLIDEVIQPLLQYQLPLIQLRKETPKEAVCLVFEKVNTGGVPLNVFELLTATFAAQNFNLRDDWKHRQKYFKDKTYRVLHDLKSDDFLQTIALLATRQHRIDKQHAGVANEHLPGIGCKRKDILALTLEDYQQWADFAVRGYQDAAKFLYDQKIFDSRDVPYRTQLIPLAAIFATLGTDAHSHGARTKIARWYWCGVFGELYGGATDTRLARDFPEVVQWVREENQEPTTVGDANFVPDRLLTMKNRISAAYKGVSAILLREDARDFMTGKPIASSLYFDEQLDIHHIFPRDWCNKREIGRDVIDSIVNKTPLGARTNRIIGNNAPSSYLAKIQRTAGIDTEQMDTILLSHCIDPQPLRSDDFSAFFDARMQSLLKLIEQAMGKPIVAAHPRT